MSDPIDVVVETPAPIEVEVWAGSGGAPLSDDTPGSLGVAAAGVSTDASRSDHVHAMPSAADVGADPAGAANAVAGDLSTHESLTTSAHGGIVAATDVRLTDARTPLAHTHAQSDVTGLVSDLADKAGLLSPVFLGSPQAPTQPMITANETLATTDFVYKALLGSISFVHRAAGSWYYNIGVGGSSNFGLTTPGRMGLHPIMVPSGPIDALLVATQGGGYGITSITVGLYPSNEDGFPFGMAKLCEETVTCSTANTSYTLNTSGVIPPSPMGMHKVWAAVLVNSASGSLLFWTLRASYNMVGLQERYTMPFNVEPMPGIFAGDLPINTLPPTCPDIPSPPSFSGTIVRLAVRVA